MSFQFSTAGKVVFGAGVARQLPDLVAGWGSRALVVTGQSVSRAQIVQEALAGAGVQYTLVRVGGEPSVADALRAVEAGRAAGAQFVVACGGGSALDLGKAAAGLLANAGDVFDYLEVVGRGRPLEHPALPCVALPTTAGTGSEVTKNAVLSAEEQRVKVSLRHDSMLPRVALVDPALTVGVPASVTAATGLDALTQCIEPYLSKQANPLTDAVALEGMRRGARSLRRAVRDGADLEARADLSLCSLFGGLALANAKLGAVHGFAGPIGGRFAGSPHGAICARLLPLVLEQNLCALRERGATAQRAVLEERFQRVAEELTGQRGASVEAGIEWVWQLCEELEIPGLSAYGMTQAAIGELVQQARRASSMQGNPVELTEQELTAVLARAL